MIYKQINKIVVGKMVMWRYTVQQGCAQKIELEEHDVITMLRWRPKGSFFITSANLNIIDESIIWAG